MNNCLIQIITANQEYVGRLKTTEKLLQITKWMQIFKVIEITMAILTITYNWMCIS